MIRHGTLIGPTAPCLELWPPPTHATLFAQCEQGRAQSLKEGGAHGCVLHDVTCAQGQSAAEQLPLTVTTYSHYLQSPAEQPVEECREDDGEDAVHRLDPDQRRVRHALRGWCAW